MAKTKICRILSVLLSLVLALGIGSIPMAAISVESQEGNRPEVPADGARFTDEFLASASEHQFEGYSIEDIQQALDDGGQIYQNLRVQSDYTGTMTYRVPVQTEEIEQLLNLRGGNIQPFNNPFDVTRIRYSGLSYADSIVILLLGDGFDEADYGVWPNPASGTVLRKADDAINAMFNTHPFGMFEDLLTVYVIHVHGTHSATGIGYLGTIKSDAESLGGTTTNNATAATDSTTRQYRINQLVDAIVPHNQQNMIQVISNAGDGTGWAWTPWHYTNNRHIAVTSVRNAHTPPGGSNAVWPSGTAWRGTIIHEFGHSFGGLVDEHATGSRNESRPNSTAAADATVKWRHWAGHRNVLATPTRFGDGWAVPGLVMPNSQTPSGCIMRASWGNRNFCGVCTAELVRRMAIIAGETFHGRSPSTNNPLPNTPTVTIPATASRILDSAFHGNTSLQTIHIPASVTEIGDFAFIGATGLTTIHNAGTVPQPINATTFAGVNRANVDVHIPAGTYNAYRAAGWTEFNLIDTAAPVAPTITSASSTVVVAGTGGTFQVTATGTAPISFDLANAPAGVSINATTGLITIAATTPAGTHNFTVTASGVAPNATQNFTLTVNPAPVAPTITTTTLPSGTVGTAYSATLAATGDTPIAWSIDSGALPAGLALNGTTGVISGTPTTDGNFTFTVRATNNAGFATRALTIAVTAVAGDTITSWEELRAAVNAAPANTPIPTVLEIGSSFAAPAVSPIPGLPGIMIGNAITIPADVPITLVGVGAEQVLTQTNGGILSGQRHFIVYGSLTLEQDITLSGGAPGNTNSSGGVEVRAGGNFTMNYGSVIENCVWMGLRHGGGVQLNGNLFGNNSTVFTMNGGTIRYNRAVSGGGVGMTGFNASFYMPGGTIANNTAQIFGGGVFLANGAWFTMDGWGDVDGARIENNHAIGVGGGVHVGMHSTFTMWNGRIHYNTTLSSGGGVAVSQNSHINLYGGYISHNEAANAGGGVFMADHSIVVFAGGVISGNQAENGGGIFMNSFSNFEFAGGVISGNTATTDGGGVYISSEWTPFIMHNGEISNNIAGNNGGGVFVAGFLQMRNGVIRDNIATNGGGVFVLANLRFEMHGGVIRDNAAQNNGGGVSASGGNLLMVDGYIYDNTANNSGGGVALSNGAHFTIGCCCRWTLPRIQYNTATNSGGGVQADSNSMFMLQYGRIISNTAPLGGGVALMGSHMSMWSGYIFQNEATDGGGVFVADGSFFEMQHGMISFNTAAENGGGVFVHTNGSFRMWNGHIENNIAQNNGGGIFSQRYSTNTVVPPYAYANLFIGADVVFSGNSAGNGASAPPDNRLTHIAATTASIFDYALNNYDINYTGRLGQVPVSGITSWEELRAAVNAAPVNIPIPTVIQIGSSFAAPGGAVGNAITIPAGVRIMLVGVGTERVLTQTNSGQRHFIVNGNLTLGQNITLSGGAPNNANNSGGVQVNGGGNFTMGEGSVIEHCMRTINGGAVALAGTGAAQETRATFTLFGGTIRNNRGNFGGGVNVGANSRMLMEQWVSQIYNNTATQNGGGVHLTGTSSTFEMNGGEINANTATNGGGVLGTGGTEITMNHGRIGDNAAAQNGGGVHLTGANPVFRMFGGIIEHNTAVTGGGIGTAAMTGPGAQITLMGGFFRSNIATTNGGGVNLLAGASLTMDGATHFVGNQVTSATAVNGGGAINLMGSATALATLTLVDGTMEGNSAPSGGGIRVAANARVNMSGGTIINNQSTTSAANGGGGGVFVSSGTIANGQGFNMTGGTISGNAARDGGGIFSTLSNNLPVVPETAYANLNIGANVVFSGNSAGAGASAPPDNRLAHIAATTASIFDYALNNYDINYRGRLGEVPPTLNFNNFFPDPALAQVVAQSLFGRQATDSVTQQELQNVTGRLHASAGMTWETTIRNIEGVQHLRSINEVSLGVHAISDISPLAGLTNLTTLQLNHNEIVDLSPLTNLVHLTTLRLNSNRITDISPLAGLVNLTTLTLGAQFIVMVNAVERANPLVIRNMITNVDESLIAPVSISNSGTYAVPYITWHGLAADLAAVSYTFNEIVTVGSATTNFSGSVTYTLNYITMG